METRCRTVLHVLQVLKQDSLEGIEYAAIEWCRNPNLISVTRCSWAHYL